MIQRGIRYILATMHGTFNGLQVRRITSREVTTDPTGTTITTIRIIGLLPELEEQLRLKAPALLILSDETIKGRIVHFNASLRYGYEITIESEASGIGT